MRSIIIYASAKCLTQRRIITAIYPQAKADKNGNKALLLHFYDLSHIIKIVSLHSSIGATLDTYDFNCGKWQKFIAN
jgi:hypothetical protein